MKQTLFLVLLLLCLARLAHADPCPAIAVLTGDPAEVDAVSRLLIARGISTTPASGCPATKARVIRVEKQILLEIEDPLGRTNRRLVSNTKAAATVIEAWVYDALEPVSFDDLFPKEAPAPAPATLPFVPDPPTEKKTELAVVELPSLPGIVSLTTRRKIELSLFSEFTRMKGGSLWFGVAGAASRRLGPLSVSLLGRFLVRADRVNTTPEEGNQSVDANECTPIDSDGDGATDFLDCDGDCIFIDIDGDGAFDDKQCQNESVACTSLDINNDGVIDDFQCDGAPQCQELNCFGLPSFDTYGSAYQLQAEVGLPLQLGKTLVTPSIAFGAGQFFSAESFDSGRVGHAEAFIAVSRNINERLRLDSRLSAAVVPNVSLDDGQLSTRLSVGLHWR